ncbi:MAG TPA: type II toxin-antitoxin system VapC family toxin [Bryobacterales bacterium]|nr:type II toxin-antitoxin system VapC family toxin [Bryobacterales bacterium]
MPGGHPRVFDSWAIIALIENEPSANVVRSLVRDAQLSHSPRWITAINLGEVWYRVARKHSQPEADMTLREIYNLGFSVESIDWPLARHAAQFKAKHAVSYADCFAAALAKQRNAELVTGDREFQRLEKEIRIRWL